LSTAAGFPVKKQAMPIFKRDHKELNYTLSANIFPSNVLFIHGNLASVRWWQPTLEILAATKNSSMSGNVLAMDWIGCGGSSAPRDQQDLEMKAIASDYVAMARAAGLAKIDLVGHSTGCLIALCAVLEAPELFTRLLLLDPVSAEGIKFGPEMFEAFTQMSKDRAFCETILMSTAHGVDTKQSFFQALVDDAFKIAPQIWHGIPRSLSHIDIKGDLKKISQPTLVLHGQHDTVLPAEGAEEIANLVQQGHYEMLRGRGHCANVEDPALFVKKLRAFFSQNA
jgi:pimeloyl-ACP methyl ester carboxylesterase